MRNWRAEYELVDGNDAIKNTAVNHWLAERNKVLPDEPKIDVLRSVENGYDYFMNCTAGAFENAAKTLAARLAAYHINPDVEDWARAQDQVFANCSETKAMPAEVGANGPEWLKNDRDYQIAAAQFYAMQYDDAKKRFVKIAQTDALEWRQLGAYMLARIAVRQAVLLN
ncbi:MAG: hypothetical protein ACXWT3_15140 [Methylococcaceae bacterium]